MSLSKSQLNSKSDVRTSTARSIPLESDGETPSILSTRTRNSFKSAFFNFMRDFKQTHKMKDYQSLVRFAGRRWHAMTQADRAPYILEAARNRRTAKQQRRPNKKQNAEDKRCPACGHRKPSRGRSHSRGGSTDSSRTRSRSSRSKSKSSNHSKK